ncbi:MAG: hypothetical protein RSD19_07370, partial [Oscillospiraceae bacterium]
MAASVVVVKIAAAVLTDEKIRKKVGWVIAAILSPIILIAAAFLCIGQGGSDHNASAVDAAFFASGITESVPVEFKAHVEDMTHSFVFIDAAAAQICQQMEGGDSLDAVRMKAVFYSLFFGDSQPSAKNISAFVNCFVAYETRTRT